MTAAPHGTPTIPELGPSFGRLCARAGASVAGIPLDDLRLALVSALFERAAAARDFLDAGDRANAVASLAPTAWRTAWTAAVQGAANRVADAVQARFAAAAAVVRLPKKRAAALVLDDDERRAVAARLGEGAAAFLASLDAAPAGAGVDGPRGDAAFVAWRDQLLASARRLEGAWLALEAAVAHESEAWEEEVAVVRAWRRPVRGLWIATAAVGAVALYLGLVFGGFLPLPAVLRPVAAFVWRYL